MHALRKEEDFGGVLHSPRSRRMWLAATLLVALGVPAYSNALTEVFVGYNAQRSIRDNPDIRQLWPLGRAMSLHLVGPAALGDGGTLVRRPVLSLSFALSRLLLGPGARGFQAANVTIHIAAALALFGIVRRTLDRTWLAFAIAALWLVHPLQTESVTYIPQRAESLMGFFFLLTLYCAIRSWDQALRPSRRRWWQAVAIVACALGMATKEVMIAAPVVVWLYDAIFVSDSYAQPVRRRPGFYAALAATWSILAVLVGATWADASLDFDRVRMWPYVLSQPRVILHYLRLAFWPHPLFLYVNTSDFWFRSGAGGIATLLPSTGVLLLLLLGTAAALRRRHWTGFLGACFFLTLAPTSSVLAASDVIQEHRMYVALAAVVALAVIATDAGVRRLAAGWPSPRAVTMLRGAGVVALLTAGILATRGRNEAYHSEFGAYAPQDLPAAYGVSASYELVRGNLPAAADLFAAMLPLPLPEGDSDFGRSLFHRARVLNALGAVRALQGRTEEAGACFTRALDLRPGFAVAQNNLAVVMLLQGSVAEARADEVRRENLTVYLTFTDPQRPFDYLLYLAVIGPDGHSSP